MCGIAGVVHFGVDGPVDELSLEKMTRTLNHRGPDGMGTYIDPEKGLCGLGHCRLAIIDLERGDQPMSNEDATIWISYNGECYNYQSLRRQLIQAGHIFKSNSDTEVIIHLYEQYGCDCVEYIRGMFAFAIWDSKARRLFLARDRLGQKPLFYAVHAGKFMFASQCKAILAVEDFPHQADMTALGHYLLLQYVPAPRTGFASIVQLPPAHTLTVTCDNYADAVPKRYWQIPEGDSFQGSFNDAVDRIRAELAEATRLRLVSDVPLGAFLSGGVDSTIVVGLMAQSRSDPVKTCSIGFTEDLYNELPWARRAANHFECDHFEQIVHPGGVETIEKLIDYYDEPFADCSALPTFHLSHLARNRVKVALSGDGGDECFGGYDRHRACQLADATNRSCLLRWISHWGLWKHIRSGEHRSFLFRIKRFANAASLAAHQRYLQWMAVFDPDMIGVVLSDDTFGALNLDDNLWDHFKDDFPESNLTSYQKGCYDSAKRAMLADGRHYLPGDLNTKVDRASMSIGLEVRSPFQDHKVVELAYSLPTLWRVHRQTGKFILKKAFADVIPPAIARRRKQGFGVPVGRWFRHELRAFFIDTVMSDRAIQRGWLNKAGVERLLRENDSRQVDHGHRLWSLLMLELWCRQYIDQKPESSLSY